MLIGPSGGQVGNVSLQGQAGLQWAWGQLRWEVQYNTPNRYQRFVQLQQYLGQLAAQRGI